MNRRTASRISRTLATVLLGACVQAATAPAATPAAAAPTALSDDIRDIRGPEPIAPEWLWALELAGAALLAAGGYGVYRWNRRRGVVAIKLPYERALEQLEAARALMRLETAQEFSIAVSNVVRRYIEERFRVMATHQTTEEFLHDLLNPSDAMLTTHRASLAEFLHDCDLVKFGGWRLSDRDMETMHSNARRFVSVTGRPALTPSGPELARGSSDKDSHGSLAAT